MRDKIVNYIKRNRVSTTEVADCLGKSGALEGVMPICKGHYKVGAIKWVYACSNSNYPVHDMIRDTQKGDIVFIESFNQEDRAIIGDLVSKYILLYLQSEAIICNARFRDASALLREHYPIWCTGFTPVGCFNKKPEPDLDAAIIEAHKAKYDGAIAVCDDCGVVIIPKECINEDFYAKLEAIEAQEDIWFDRLDHYKENTFDIVCLKTYLNETTAPVIVRNKASEGDIRDFLIEHSNDFLVPFNEQVDIDSYAKKLRTFGNTYEIWHEGKLDALLVIYYNLDDKEIFVPYICTAGARAGKHLGQKLFNEITQIRAPFTGIRLFCRNDNTRAMQFYTQLGFQKIGTTEEKTELFRTL
ncbi:MAG: hypothetical protein IKV13_05455 [Akkermansia sp.]|nr:hypothetical protein [Akkermansia sp.]